MKNIIKQIQEEQTFNRNKLRFTLSHLMEGALKKANLPEACMFLKITLDVDLATAKEIYTRFEKGESFTDITNDINKKGFFN